jgi:DDE superfamily endonuclease
LSNGVFLYQRNCINVQEDLTIDEVEEYFTGFKAFIDSTEQEIPRPENKRKRKRYYSGKKKKHTVKTQYMVNIEGLGSTCLLIDFI